MCRRRPHGTYPAQHNPTRSLVMWPRPIAARRLAVCRAFKSKAAHARHSRRMHKPCSPLFDASPRARAGPIAPRVRDEAVAAVDGHAAAVRAGQLRALRARLWSVQQQRRRREGRGRRERASAVCVRVRVSGALTLLRATVALFCATVARCASPLLRPCNARAPFAARAQLASREYSRLDGRGATLAIVNSTRFVQARLAPLAPATVVFGPGAWIQAPADDAHFTAEMRQLMRAVKSAVGSSGRAIFRSCLRGAWNHRRGGLGCGNTPGCDEPYRALLRETGWEQVCERSQGSQGRDEREGESGGRGREARHPRARAHFFLCAFTVALTLTVLHTHRAARRLPSHGRAAPPPHWLRGPSGRPDCGCGAVSQLECVLQQHDREQGLRRPDARQL
eukprot:1777723-Prymnesium_polylepis.1